MLTSSKGECFGVADCYRVPSEDKTLPPLCSVPATRKPSLTLRTARPSRRASVSHCARFLPLFFSHQPISIEGVLPDAGVILSADTGPDVQHAAMRGPPKNPEFKKYSCLDEYQNENTNFKNSYRGLSATWKVLDNLGWTGTGREREAPDSSKQKV